MPPAQRKTRAAWLSYHRLQSQEHLSGTKSNPCPRQGGIHLAGMMLRKTTKLLSVGVVLIFGLSILGAAAADRPGCGRSCCMTDAPAVPPDPMGMAHPSTTTCGCCAGSQQTPCDVQNSAPFDDQAYVVFLPAPPSGDPSAMALVADRLPIDGVSVKRMRSQQDLARSARSSPIYLLNLSLLM